MIEQVAARPLNVEWIADDEDAGGGFVPPPAINYNFAQPLTMSSARANTDAPPPVAITYPGAPTSINSNKNVFFFLFVVVVLYYI